jgi:large subunit ribosomal protein L2
MVIDLVHCPAHSAPLAVLESSTRENYVVFAPDKISVGTIINDLEPNLGCVLKLGDIPEGSVIHNLERVPGDGGKMVRGSGAGAKVLTKTDKGVFVELPSKKKIVFGNACRASIGIVAGGGRPEKPMMKAGKNHHAKHARKKLNAIVCGISMNAVAHPFGSKCSHTKGRPTQSARNDPPGRKVGKIAPKRTGRKKRK